MSILGNIAGRGGTDQHGEGSAGIVREAKLDGPVDKRLEDGQVRRCSHQALRLCIKLCRTLNAKTPGRKDVMRRGEGLETLRVILPASLRLRAFALNSARLKRKDVMRERACGAHLAKTFYSPGNSDNLGGNGESSKSS